MLSANTVAQNPAGSVMPPLSPVQAATAAALCRSCAAEGETVANSVAIKLAHVAIRPPRKGKCFMGCSFFGGVAASQRVAGQVMQYRLTASIIDGPQRKGNSPIAPA